jgi:TPP-dependent pyruvate/acetoin dehydrogenase alpha subunit
MLEYAGAGILPNCQWHRGPGRCPLNCAVRSVISSATEPRASAQGAATPAGLERRTDIYRAQVRVRYFEKEAYDLFLQNLVKGTSHLSIGQEAIAAGVAAALRPDDYVFATYRGHAHALLRGAPMAAVLGELLGRQTGLMAGKGGSMHLTYTPANFMGSYAIVGAHLTIANGAAWSAQYRGTDQVAVVFFGDGTTNIGAFHEALNLAATWKLQVVFMCENNLYMEYTPINQVTAVRRPAADRASAYGLEPLAIDGNDADIVYEVALEAVARARSGAGPSLVEAVTYRHGGHSRADPGKYRPDTEVAEWLAKDPIPRYRERLLQDGAERSVLDQIEAEARAEVDDAREQAKAAPVADPSSVEREVFADGGSTWRR